MSICRLTSLSVITLFFMIFMLPGLYSSIFYSIGCHLLTDTTLLQMECKLPNFNKGSRKQNHSYWTTFAWGDLRNITLKLWSQAEALIFHGLQEMSGKESSGYSAEKSTLSWLKINQVIKSTNRGGKYIKNASDFCSHVTQLCVIKLINKLSFWFKSQASEVLQHTENTHALRKRLLWNSPEWQYIKDICTRCCSRQTLR